jgi:hypothetical protein
VNRDWPLLAAVALAIGIVFVGSVVLAVVSA